jgi:integrase/recombinase XerD
MTNTTNRMTPTSVYLLSLQSQASKRVMASRLNITAKMLQGKSSHDAINWSEVNYQVVLGLVATMKAEGKSPTTINSYIAAVKGASKEAWRGKELDIESYQHLKEIKRVRGSRSDKGRSLTVEELRKLVDFDSNDYITIRDSAIIALSYGGGLRRSETANLKLSDIDMSNGTVSLVGKGNKASTNSLSDKTLEILGQWIKVRGSKEGKLFLRVNKGNKLTGSGISDQSVYNIVKQRQVAAGIEGISTHDLRRSFVTNLLESGEDVFTVQKLARHADVATTQVYDKRNRSVQDSAAKRLAF